ncbi:acyl carrier protein [Chitinimonas lacunae]|uniref:Acyl carrier protein n=1 Tax=Chitinimonas lacunae TaxID=1963018 RepID=A0ABV8MX82_9NEIS
MNQHDTLRPVSETDVVAWLRSYLSRLLGIPLQDIDPDKTFERYGLDSSAAVGMTGDLGDWLGVEIDAAAAYDNPTINQLARSLAASGALNGRRAVALPAGAQA